MHYQGIFFDFDYTLGDSTIPILRGYQEGFRALGWDAPTLEQVRPTIGMTLMEGYRQLSSTITRRPSGPASSPTDSWNWW